MSPASNPHPQSRGSFERTVARTTWLPSPGEGAAELRYDEQELRLIHFLSVPLTGTTEPPTHNRTPARKQNELG